MRRILLTVCTLGWLLAVASLGRAQSVEPTYDPGARWMRGGR